MNQMRRFTVAVMLVQIILLAEKFLKSDWLRQAVLHPYLKRLHGEITVAVATGWTALSCC